MTNEDFVTFREEATAARIAMADRKSVDYTRGNFDDRFINFKRAGEELKEIGDPALWAIANHILKHMDAIWQYLKTQKDTSEPIEGRIDDEQNYLEMLPGLFAEVCGALDALDALRYAIRRLKDSELEMARFEPSH